MTAEARHPFSVRLPGPPVAAVRLPSAESLGIALLREGVIEPHQMVAALSVQSQRKGYLADILLARGLIEPTLLYDLIARHWSCGFADLAAAPAAPDLLMRFGVARCLSLGLIPWCQAGGATVIATAYPEDFARNLAALTAVFGPVLLAVAPMSQIEAAVLAACGPDLARRAEEKVASDQSCRGLRFGDLHFPLLLAMVPLITLAVLWPIALLIMATALAALLALANTGLKLAAWRVAGAAKPEPPGFQLARLPKVSVMVALYKESRILPRMVQRLSLLEYPRDLLEVILVVEADDHGLRAALAKTELPGWMRVVVVPDGPIKTKPRALNYALDHCRGSLIGIYDAEDAPAPDQLRKMAHHFHRAGPEVACLQGVLDYYNPRSNWLARCFTIEYASWYRMFLPGIARLGLAVPLGGTTLFFRREALEKLGGWDAHNVTEDADLGMRLARHGYRTDLFDSVTMEEANCRALPWVKQRSRWIKGYMLTWATHMRDPSLLWHQLGPKRFAGLQLQLIGSVLQALLAPLLWSLWIVPFGLPHPFVTALSPSVFTAFYTTSLVVEAITVSFSIAALARTSHRLSPLWVPTLMFYYPLATFAAYKALWEILAKPFYWDKTSHGLFDG